MALLVHDVNSDKITHAPSPTLKSIAPICNSVLTSYVSDEVSTSTSTKSVCADLPRKRKWFTEAEHGASPEHGEPTKRPKVRPNSKTKVLGVYPSWNVTGTYTAQIKYSKGKRKYLGDNYSTIEEAKKVYAEAEEEIRGPVFQCSTCSEEWNVKGKKLKDGESWNCPHCVKESDKLKSYINPLYLQRPIERVQKIGKSGHRGVNEQNKKWLSQFYSGGLQKHLGTYNTCEEAVAAFKIYENRSLGKIFDCSCKRSWYVKRKTAPFEQADVEKQDLGKAWLCPKCDPVPFANSLELGLAFLLCGIKRGKVL